MWLPVPTYLDYEYGLALVDDLAELEAWLAQREDSFEYETFRVPDGEPHEPKVRQAPFPVFRLPSLATADQAYWWRN